MKRIIHKIRLQPPAFRIMVAVIAALILTGIIAVFWIATISTGTVQDDTSTAPTPFNSLVSNIKSAVNSDNADSPLQNSNQVQVINSDDPSAMQTDSAASTGTPVMTDDVSSATTTTDDSSSSDTDDSSTYLLFNQQP